MSVPQPGTFGDSHTCFFRMVRLTVGSSVSHISSSDWPVGSSDIVRSVEPCTVVLFRRGTTFRYQRRCSSLIYLSAATAVCIERTAPAYINPHQVRSLRTGLCSACQSVVGASAAVLSRCVYNVKILIRRYPPVRQLYPDTQLSLSSGTSTISKTYPSLSSGTSTISRYLSSS